MMKTSMLNNPRLTVSPEPPYDVLQAFVRNNHIAMKGAEEGPLKGLVFAAKDVFKILGSTVGNGHPEWLQTHEPDEFTSPIIAKLLEAGADLVGKTIADELCYSISGENWNYGSPINPNDARRYAGGSSSGSAAATAGGLVDFSLGSDCLGSVRVPSGYNGILGMRPTFRRLPSEGEVPYCASFDMPGFMAASPEVFKKVAGVLLGEDEKPTKITKLLIAKDCMDAVNPDVSASLKPAVEFLSRRLGDVEEITVSKEGLPEWAEIFRIVQGYEVYRSYGGWANKYKPHLNRGPKERLAWASTVTYQEYTNAYKKRMEILKRVEEIVPAGAVLCLPTAASVAPLRTASLDDINATRLQSTYLTCIAPLSEVPQVNLPMVTQDEVPLGISLIGAKGTDRVLADFAADIVAEYNR